MFASRLSTWDLRSALTFGSSRDTRSGALSESENRFSRSFRIACQTPLLGLGNLGGNGKASLTSAPTTVVARTSPVAAGSDGLDHGGGFRIEIFSSSACRPANFTEFLLKSNDGGNARFLGLKSANTPNTSPVFRESAWMKRPLGTPPFHCVLSCRDAFHRKG